jgi:hypothetical protein
MVCEIGHYRDTLIRQCLETLGQEEGGVFIPRSFE